MDDNITSEFDAIVAEPRDAAPLTRRQALAATAAGAVGVTTVALGSQTAGAAATKISAERYNRTVIVHAPKAIVFDIEKVQAIQHDLLHQFGCPGCHSGFTFHYPDEMEYVIGTEGLAAQRVSSEDIIGCLGDDQPTAAG